MIDVDGDMKWYDAFCDKYDIPPTTTVLTPSGGKHEYFEYDPRVKNSTKGFSNATKAKRANLNPDEHAIDIDCRNDGGVAVMPGSLYNIAQDDRAKKKHKLKFIGKPYVWQIDDDSDEGELMGFEFIQPLPSIFVQWAHRGLNRETMELLPVRPKAGKITQICPDKIKEKVLKALLNGISKEGMYDDADYSQWM